MKYLAFLVTVLISFSCFADSISAVVSNKQSVGMTMKRDFNDDGFTSFETMFGRDANSTGTAQTLMGVGVNLGPTSLAVAGGGKVFAAGNAYAVGGIDFGVHIPVYAGFSQPTKPNFEISVTERLLTDPNTVTNNEVLLGVGVKF